MKTFVAKVQAVSPFSSSHCDAEVLQATNLVLSISGLSCTRCVIAKHKPFIIDVGMECSRGREWD